MRAAFDENGYATVTALLAPERCVELAARLQPAGAASGGTRCLLNQDWCADLARDLRRHPRLQAFLAPDSVAVQCTYFEKSTARNWLVPLHQDLSIPVAARLDSPALRGWSTKEDVLFVQPPAAVLEQLLAVRVHLDPCGADDGPLLVVPGSHRGGIIGDADALALREARPAQACLADAGSGLLIRPLLLHQSSKGSGAGRRRVLHFVFGPPALPLGLHWHMAI